MGIAMLRLHCYLAEWYRSGTTEDDVDRTAAALERAGAATNFEGSPVALISLLAVPTDEILFGVFAADSEHLVAEICDRAGIPANRLTAAVDAHVAKRASHDS
ncbi:MAG: hypothetical protein QOJ24_2179 [Mycobacterium sp.]|jgi:hypothetical protein|nr:hypothetical protein [Mycobacterium sp.]